MENNQSGNDFDEPRWSVLTFDDCAASGLTYAEAAEFVAQHKGEMVGLCIVTEDAAKRMIKGKTNGDVSAAETGVSESAKFSDML